MRHVLFRRPRLAALAVSLLLCGAIAGVALATTPQTGVITACAGKRGGALRVVTPGRHGRAGGCARTERQLAWNQRGAQGIPGPQGSAGQPGIQGARGLIGPPGPITGTLPRGVTETGPFVARGVTNPYDSSNDTAISFPLSVPAGVSAYYVYPGGPATPCAGSLSAPTAPAGTMCLYQGVSSNLIEVQLVDPVTTNGTAVALPSGSLPSAPPVTVQPFGVIIRADANGTGSFYDYGTWAVTAP